MKKSETIQQLIARNLKNSKKPFNSIHVKYEVKDPNAKGIPLTDEEVIELLRTLE